MPSITAGSFYATGTGNSGNGYCRITFSSHIKKSLTNILEEKAAIKTQWDFSTIDSYQIFVPNKTGTYQIEAWGAKGSNGNKVGGYGSYTKGEIYLEQGEQLYIYAGGQGTSSAGGWNGGGGVANGKEKCGGGGGTDIRYFENTPTASDLVWNSTLGLNSRIMVAAGGGGGSYAESSNKHGGGIANFDLSSTQTYGYIFGTGKTGTNSTSSSSPGGGGGGYYGGPAAATYDIAGSGGSSYISGHPGCNSKNRDGIFTGGSIHFTEKYFSNTLMIDGMGYRWSNIKGTQTTIKMPYGGTYATGVGNNADGYVRIKNISYNSKSASTITQEKASIKNNGNYYTYIDSYQIFMAPITGTYKMEAWGAQGAKGTRIGGYGSYTSGNISLTANEKLYIYVGSKGTSEAGGWNGGGGITNGTEKCGGGGATDVRYFNGTPAIDYLTWNNGIGLNARIMVAAGGGGGSYTDTNNKHGGGLANYAATSNQTTGYEFGIGKAGSYSGGNSSPGGGGGGWYGGTAATTYDIAGSGGSSYISGHTGSVAIANLNETISPREALASCSTGSSSRACSIHATGKNFITDTTIIIDGMGYIWTNVKGGLNLMPNPWGSTFDSATGNTENGYFRITLIN